MHPRNPHKDKYDLTKLSQALPELSQFIFINQYGDQTIDFSNYRAVRALNKAILKSEYQISFWDIPQDFLCPPIPSRAEYIHQISDLFNSRENLRVLDIGVGANCIYPIIGQFAYQWRFVGTDINQRALESAQHIIEQNKLDKKIELRLQVSHKHFFKNIIQPEEVFDLTICNPPFHENQESRKQGTIRKWNNLGKSQIGSQLNFGGQDSELWCPGGEKEFVLGMIKESLAYSNQVKWFSSLIAKRENLDKILKEIKKLPITFKIIEFEVGNKKSRILVWRTRN
jgi:23S rRNA (adenine1618-N6)-methyltransferase